MSGIEGQRWKHKPGQKVRISSRITEETNKKLEGFVNEEKKKGRIKNKSQAVSSILEEKFQ